MKRGKKKKEATGSLANAKEISTDSAVKVVLPTGWNFNFLQRHMAEDVLSPRRCFSSNFCNVFVEYHEASHGANTHLALPLAPIRSQALLLI